MCLTVSFSYLIKVSINLKTNKIKDIKLVLKGKLPMVMVFS